MEDSTGDALEDFRGCADDQAAETLQVTDAEPLKLSVPKRLTRERRWNAHTIKQRDELMSHARKVLSLEKEAAQEWCYAELAKIYPPLPPRPAKKTGPKEAVASSEDKGAEHRKNPQKTPEIVDAASHAGIGIRDGIIYSQTKTGTAANWEDLDSEAIAIVGAEEGEGDRAKNPPNRGGTTSRRPPKGSSEDLSVTGLDRIPASWPKLPPNATLAAEIQWVQSSRIDVVQERSDGSVVVRLGRAERPAPSKAALGWLETSIRAYAKYCDIAARAAASFEDEQEVVRRERLSIERVRQLLGEMTTEKRSPF